MASNLRWKALWDYHAQHSDELSFKQGDTFIAVEIDQKNKEWLVASQADGNNRGLIPSNYVRQMGEVSSDDSDSDTGTDIDSDDDSENNEVLVECVDSSCKDAEARKELTRKRVIQEIICTEERFCSSLRILISNYKVPFEECLSTGPILTAEEIELVFKHVPVIQKLHSAFYEDLCKENKGAGKVGAVFLRFSPFLRAYSPYLAGANACMAALQRARQDPARGAALQAFESAQPQSLDNLLIKPVQRIPQFEMLLQSLNKYTSDHFHDKADIVRAIARVHDIAVRNNLSVREHMDSEAQVASLQRYPGLPMHHRLQRKLLKTEQKIRLFEKEGGNSVVTLLVCNDLVAIADPADNTIRSLLHFPVRCAELPSTGAWLRECNQASGFQLFSSDDAERSNRVWFLMTESPTQRVSLQATVEQTVQQHLDKLWTKATTRYAGTDPEATVEPTGVDGLIQTTCGLGSDMVWGKADAPAGRTGRCYAQLQEDALHFFDRPGGDEIRASVPIGPASSATATGALQIALTDAQGYRWIGCVRTSQQRDTWLKALTKNIRSLAMANHVSTLSQQTAALEAALKREAEARTQAEADRAAAEQRALAIQKDAATAATEHAEQIRQERAALDARVKQAAEQQVQKEKERSAITQFTLERLRTRLNSVDRGHPQPGPIPLTSPSSAASESDKTAKSATAVSVATSPPQPPKADTRPKIQQAKLMTTTTTMHMLQVQVPRGVLPGQTFRACHDGFNFRIRAPPYGQPGTRFMVRLPRRQKRQASAPIPPQRSLKGAVETVVSSHPNPNSAGTQPKKARIWEKRRKGNRVYYANLVTRKTQWERPDGYSSDGDQPATPASTSNTASTGSEWKKAFSKKHNCFFYKNMRTKETRWTLPNKLKKIL